MSAAGMPPIDDPAHDGLAVELGRVILWERAQLPPVVLGQCEVLVPDVDRMRRCSNIGMLCKSIPPTESFECPSHGAEMVRAVRRYPR